MITRFFAKTEELSKKLNIDYVSDLGILDQSSAIFDFDSAADFNPGDQQLILHLLLDGKADRLSFDLTDGEVAKRASQVSKSNEVIAKAIGCKSHYRPNVLDATAGMGRDSLMMAMLGCEVVMQERNFAIFHLLENALERLKNDSLTLCRQDSIQSLTNDKQINVIYLDPMFPERKKTALVKKEMRLFKLLTGDDLDSDQLLSSALQSKVSRVVVKRPKGAPFLGDKKPSHEIKSKKFRYDVYLC